MNLKQGILDGDKRAVARLISLAENGDPEAF
ncbi:MAG: GTPase, partial [Thermosediminibacterales bacterium]|nr:GTPase [Thermosediminibacterales bacterium]